jgi:hypothetical protein
MAMMDRATCLLIPRRLPSMSMMQVPLDRQM